MTVPDGFPARMSDDDLANTVDEWISGYSRLYGDVGQQLPELKLALIGAALQEQSRRESAGLRSSAKTSLRVALIALLVAVLSLLATVVIAVTG